VEANFDECPKLDGLACNFVLATPEKLEYAALVEALVQLVGVVRVCEWGARQSLLCTAQYLFGSAWRMLLLLPPAAPLLARLGLTPQDPAHVPLLLYALVWGPRTANPLFAPYIKDNLVKQVNPCDET